MIETTVRAFLASFLMLFALAVIIALDKTIGLGPLVRSMVIAIIILGGPAAWIAVYRWLDGTKNGE